MRKRSKKEANIGDLRRTVRRGLLALLAVALLAGVPAPSFGRALETSQSPSERAGAPQGEAQSGMLEPDGPDGSGCDAGEVANAPETKPETGGPEGAGTTAGTEEEAALPAASKAIEGGAPAAEPLDADGQERASSLATTFQELSSAVASPEIDTVVLGGDIVMTGPIPIPASKPALTIDGQGRYTLEQQGATTFTSSATTSPVYTLRNMTIIGRTYYGVVSCTATSGAPTIVLDNVDYTGPQLVYNRYGNVSFVGENNVVIKSNGYNSNAAEEIGEVHGVSVHGTLTVESTTVGNAFFWMFGAGTEKPYLTIENGAQASFKTSANTGRGFFWVEGTTYNVVLNVDDDASLLVDITGHNPLSTAEDHRVDSMRIGKNATAVFNFAGGIALSNELVVEEGAVLRMNYLNKPGTNGSAYAYPLFRFLSPAGGDPVVQIDRAKAVVFAVQPSNRPIFGLAQANSLRFATTDFNCWPTYAAAAAQEKPARMWSSEDPDGLFATLDLAAGQDVLKSTTSNHDGLAAEFDPKNARVIQVGTEPLFLAPDRQWTHSVAATGSTEPAARVYIDYAGNDGSERSFSGTSDDAGRYSVAIDNAAVDSRTALEVTSVHDFIALKKKVAVLEAGNPSADPVLQIVRQGDPFPADAWALVKNADAGDEGPLQAVIAEAPGTDVVGPAVAKVVLTNATGKSTLVRVPVFVTDESTVVDAERGIALRAEDFSFRMSEFPRDDAARFVLDRSRAQAWDVLTGEDLSAEIVLPDDPLAEAAGTQTVMLSARDVERAIAVTIVDEAQWVDVRIPTKMLFGTLDVYGSGKIVSPLYEIENGSDLPVNVSLAGFNVVEGDGINLMSGPEAATGGNDLKLDLDVDGTTVLEYLRPFAAESPSGGWRTTLAPSARSRLAFSGTYFGTFSPEAVSRPSYSLVWSFVPVFEGEAHDR